MFLKLQNLESLDKKKEGVLRNCFSKAGSMFKYKLGETIVAVFLVCIETACFGIEWESLPTSE